MHTSPTAASTEPVPPDHILVADHSLQYRPIAISDTTPTGHQLARAAGFKSSTGISILEILEDGDLEDIRPDEVVNLANSLRRFIVVEADRSYRLTANGQRFDWPCRVISGRAIRVLSSIPDDHTLYLEKSEVPDQIVENDQLVDLDSEGVEEFKSRPHTWQLKVQNVTLTLHHPTISAREAMIKAHFDVNQCWTIILKVKDQPKREITLDTVIDLRTPGLEKLRLIPKDIKNGEAPSAPRRDFDLLDVDEEFLDQFGYRWETILEGSSRWLLIHNFEVIEGYTTATVILALLVPGTYPGAEIDMFYTYPRLSLVSGQSIDRANINVVISGLEFIGWSRHRGEASKWNPNFDNVKTHIALVEASIAKEVGQ